MPNDKTPRAENRPQRRSPDSPFRADAATASSPNGQAPPSPTDDPLANREELARQTSKVKVGVGVGVALGVAAVGGFLLFRMLNRMKVEGLENIPEGHANVLYCPNHSSILDNFALGVGLYIPRMFFKPEYMPINLADRKNFFGDPKSRRIKDRVLRVMGEYFFKNLRTFPVDRGAAGLDQVEHWVEMLKSNIVIVFPEGTRSRTGAIGRGKAGVGKMIHEARPTVVPVRLIGTDEVLGVGKLVPNVFRTVRIIIGKPLDLDTLIDRPKPDDPDEEKDFYRDISNKVVTAIRALAPGQPLPLDGRAAVPPAKSLPAPEQAPEETPTPSAE